MSNNKFHKILSDTIILPLLPADKFNETNTGYYAVLEKNYIPITSDIECIYKPDWITGYKFIKECEKDNETNGNLKYYNKLIITSISDNTTEKLRKDVMEFAVRNNVQSLTPINHIYAKVSQVPKENIEVHLEFIPTKVQEKHLNKDGGVISGDEQEIHIKYWAVLNGRNQSNVTLNLNGNLLDKDKIKSLKINSSDNTVELVYLIDENIGSQKTLEFEAIFKTQYNEVNQQKSIIQNVNTYTITLDIDKPNPVVFKGDNRILTYKCTYTDGINATAKEVKDNLQLEFSYDNTQNQMNYSVIKTIYVDGAFKTTINVDENYTSEQRYLKVNVVYDNGSNKLKSAVKQIIQEGSTIKLQYYVEYLDRNTTEHPSANGTYNVSAFGETIRLHYYGIIKIDEKNSVKITSVTNTKNDISTAYTINALIDGVQYNNVTLNDDEYILDINFDRNESASITKTIKFNMNDISSASCKLTQGVLSINLEINHDECTEKIGGIPEYNNIILVFRAFDEEKGITIKDVNLYTITCDNDDVNLLDIQYEIITYENINYVVASNIRCKNIYDKNVDRRLTFTVKYNTKTVSHDVTQKSVVYACEIRPSSNYVSALGEDRFEVISAGIIKDGYLDKHLETSVDNVQFTNTYNDNTPGYIHVIQGNRKLLNKSQSIIKVDPQNFDGDNITSKKNITFRIKVKYHNSTNYYDIKQLYLQIYVELYKDSSYSTLLEYEKKKLCISPFINNILYYKCYVCEINKDDGSLKRVDISKFQRKDFSIYYDNWVVVEPYVDENPTYNKEDYTYRGKITILRYICSKDITYIFRYRQYYSNGNSNDDNNKYIFKILNIYKPEIKTTPDNKNTLSGTYIQYRSDNDSSYNGNKSILKIGTTDKRISSKGYQVTLYYRTVFTLDLSTNDNYIYGNSYKTYIDLDKTHFRDFVNKDDITIDNNEFSNAEEVVYNNSSYLKITFNVNKNDGLTERTIHKSIKYQFTDDTINGTDYHYTQNAFTNYKDNDNNRIEIYQDGASLDLSAFFDSSNAGEISDSSRTITYNAKPQLKQNLHVRVLLNDELQPTQSEYFKFIGNNTFQIDNGTLDSTLNTYKSEYNLTDLYIEPENKTYILHYCYNDDENNKTTDLTVIRKSFGKDDKCELNAEIDKTEISNNGETVKITFWLTYTNNEIIDLGEDAIGKFIYKFGKNDEKPVAIKPSSNTFTVVYNQKTKKYSFDSTINANLTINPITYKFIIQFGDDDDKHKKTLTCTQGSSSYELKATIEQPTLLPLSPLSPSNIIIKCNVEKDNKDEIYPDVYERNFSIIQTNETKDENGNNRLTELSSGLQLGEYRKEYKVANNKTANSITYEFKCSYTLNGKPYEKSLSITQSGAKFGVSIYDGETDQSKQNIVNPVGEIKTIKYCGLLNDKHILNDEVTFSYNKDYIISVGLPVAEGDYITRTVTFGLNNSPTQISYTFTATYEGKEKSITLTQDSAIFELYAIAYYIKDSEKIEDETELELAYNDSGYLYIQYYAKVKDGTKVDLDKTHYTVEYSKYDDGDMIYEMPINFTFVDTTVDNVNNTIVNKYRFSANNNDSYDYERYVNFKITFHLPNVDLPNVEPIEILVMQNSSYNIAMSPFDFLIFKYEFLSHEGTSTSDKDKMNNQFGHDLDTITHITTKTDALMPYKNITIDASNNAQESYVFINNLTAGYGMTIGTGVTKYKDIILFGGDNMQGEHESVYINLKNIINTINSYTDKKLQKKCRYIYIDLYGHFYGKMGNGRLQITYNTYNMKGSTPNLSLNDFIYSTTDTPVNSGVIIKSVVMDKGNNSYSSPKKDHYTLLGRLTYDMKRQSGNLAAKTLYGYTYVTPTTIINASIFDVTDNHVTTATYYKLDRTFKDLNVTALIINGTVYQFFSNPLILLTKTINKTQITSSIKDEEVTLKPFLYSYFHSLEKGMQYNNITSISINTSTTDHLICEMVDEVFKLKMKETYVNHTYNWPTDRDKQIDIVINYSPILKINSTDDIKLIIRVIEQKYTQTT